MRRRILALLAGASLCVALLVSAVPAGAAGFSAGGALIQDPEMPVVLAVFLRSGFSESDANTFSESVFALLDDSATGGIDTSGTLAFSRADLVSFGLGDADALDAFLRNIGIFYASITANVISDPIIGGDAIRFDLRVPSLSEQVLGSVILPYSLVIDPLAFLSGLGVDLGGLAF